MGWYRVCGWEPEEDLLSALFLLFCFQGIKKQSQLLMVWVAMEAQAWDPAFPQMVAPGLGLAGLTLRLPCSPPSPSLAEPGGLWVPPGHLLSHCHPTPSETNPNQEAIVGITGLVQLQGSAGH